MKKFDYLFKNPNDWYSILQQAMLKGPDNHCVLVPNDFSLSALDQLLQAADDVDLRLKPLSLHVATAIGAHLWFGEGEYPLIIIGCYLEKVHVCIAATSDYTEKNDHGKNATKRYIEITSIALDLEKHQLASQLENLLKAHGLNAKNIECSFIYGEVDFLHSQLDGCFSNTPLDQSQMHNYVPADVGLKCMNAILNGEEKDYVLIDISPHSLIIFAYYGKNGRKKLLTVPDNLDLSLALPHSFQLFLFIYNEKFWVIQSLHDLSPDSDPPYAFPYDSHPSCALPYDSDNPPTKLVLMQKDTKNKLMPYKEFEIAQLHDHNIINLTFNYHTNGQIKITQDLIKRPE